MNAVVRSRPTNSDRNWLTSFSACWALPKIRASTWRRKSPQKWLATATRALADASSERHSADTAGLRHEKSMNQEPNSEAAETAQTMSVLAVDLPRLVRLLAVAQPVMEAWAKSHELDEWHCRCEDLIGTAYPSNLCPICCVESSINWRDGNAYYYCPDHGELNDLYCEPNAEVSHAAPPAASDKPTAQRGGVALH